MKSECCKAPCPKEGRGSSATFSPRGPNNQSPPVGIKEEGQMKAGNRGWFPWSPPLFSITHPEENLIKSTYQEPHKREMRTHERKEGERRRWKEGGDGGMAAMTDAPHAASSLTFRIAGELWTSGGRIKHTNTGKNKNNADTKTQILCSKTRVHVSKLLFQVQAEFPGCQLAEYGPISKIKLEKHSWDSVENDFYSWRYKSHGTCTALTHTQTHKLESSGVSRCDLEGGFGETKWAMFASWANTHMNTPNSAVATLICPLSKMITHSRSQGASL